MNHASSEQRGKVFANDLDDYFTEYLEVKKVPSVTVYHNGEDLDEDERRKTLLLAEKALGDEDEPVKMLETVVVDAQWDCESILSTYSNVANHPKIIEAPVSKNKPRKAPTEKVAFADAAETTKKEEPVEEKVCLFVLFLFCFCFVFVFVLFLFCFCFCFVLFCLVLFGFVRLFVCLFFFFFFFFSN